MKPILFLMEPEKAHHFTIRLLKIALSIPGGKGIFKILYNSSERELEREVFGLKFKNPVGLAAGFDKDGKYFEAMSYLGFGFIEIGTVTPLAQDGNPQPRLFRLPEDNALVNRMGFNNEGVNAMVNRLKNRKKSGLIVGGNIGKNKMTPNAEATEDYIKCFNALFPYVDYFVVNVSSPNTPGLRELQEKKPLTKLLSTLQELNNSEKQDRKPLLLKIAPDLNDSQLDDIISIAVSTGLDGLIVSNTTISRDELSTPDARLQEIGNGGLSGLPVTERSTEIIRYISSKTDKSLVIIGVGGISSYESAQQKLDAGASLVQIYSGLIYEGPSLVRKINRALVDNETN